MLKHIQTSTSYSVRPNGVAAITRPPSLHAYLIDIFNRFGSQTPTFQFIELGLRETFGKRPSSDECQL